MLEYAPFLVCIDFEELKGMSLEGVSGVTPQYTNLNIYAKMCIGEDHCKDEQEIRTSAPDIALTLVTAFNSYDPSNFEGEHLFR